MEFEPTEFVRKSFNVKAYELTLQNAEAVAKWCKGTVGSEKTRILGGGEIDLPVVKFPGQGEDRGKELVARVGYFIVLSKGRFRVYKAPQFHAAFEQQVKVEAVGPQQKDEVWIDPNKIDEADYCIDHNLPFAECNDAHLLDATVADQEKEDALHNAGQL